jgi:membrane protein
LPLIWEFFESYNRLYGSLGAGIGFMVWIWLSVVVILIGAELNAEMEHQTARDTTAGGEKPSEPSSSRSLDGRAKPAD